MTVQLQIQLQKVKRNWNQDLDGSSKKGQKNDHHPPPKKFKNARDPFM